MSMENESYALDLLANCSFNIIIVGRKLNNTTKVERDMSVKDYCWEEIINSTNCVFMQLIFIRDSDQWQKKKYFQYNFNIYTIFDEWQPGQTLVYIRGIRYFILFMNRKIFFYSSHFIRLNEQGSISNSPPHLIRKRRTLNSIELFYPQILYKIISRLECIQIYYFMTFSFVTHTSLLTNIKLINPEAQIILL